jgi:hypothetical protein
LLVLTVGSQKTNAYHEANRQETYTALHSLLMA